MDAICIIGLVALYWIVVFYDEKRWAEMRKKQAEHCLKGVEDYYKKPHEANTLRTKEVIVNAPVAGRPDSRRSGGRCDVVHVPVPHRGVDAAKRLVVACRRRLALSFVITWLAGGAINGDLAHRLTMPGWALTMSLLLHTVVALLAMRGIWLMKELEE